MKKILLLATGGTIASVETAEGLSPAQSPERLLSYVPEARSVCHVDVEQPFCIDSTNIQPEHWVALAKRICAVRCV